MPEKFKGDGSDVVTDEALKFIRKQAAAGKPFLAVVWFGNPHVPHIALPDGQGSVQVAAGEGPELLRRDHRHRPQRRPAAGGAARSWASRTTPSSGTAATTAAPAGPKSTGFLRGGKGTLWEGGCRVPGIVEWPARIPRPVVSSVPCSTLDMYPTILAATGATAEKQIQPLDGINLLPLFDGKMTERGKADPVRGPDHQAQVARRPDRLAVQAASQPRRGQEGRQEGRRHGAALVRRVEGPEGDHRPCRATAGAGGEDDGGAPCLEGVRGEEPGWSRLRAELGRPLKTKKQLKKEKKAEPAATPPAAASRRNPKERCPSRRKGCRKRSKPLQPRPYVAYISMAKISSVHGWDGSDPD